MERWDREDDLSGECLPWGEPDPELDQVLRAVGRSWQSALGMFMLGALLGLLPFALLALLAVAFMAGR